MVKIYLTVAGDVSDVIDTIRQLAAGNGSAPATAPNNPNRDPGGDRRVDPPVQTPVDDTATVAQDPWTEELVRALWQLLTTALRISTDEWHTAMATSWIETLCSTPWG